MSRRSHWISPTVNDVRRVADIVGDDVGYPAPRLALHGAVFPQAGEAPPALAGLLWCEHVSCLASFYSACSDGSSGSEGTP